MHHFAPRSTLAALALLALTACSAGLKGDAVLGPGAKPTPPPSRDLVLPTGAALHLDLTGLDSPDLRAILGTGGLVLPASVQAPALPAATPAPTTPPYAGPIPLDPNTGTWASPTPAVPRSLHKTGGK